MQTGHKPTTRAFRIHRWVFVKLIVLLMLGVPFSPTRAQSVSSSLPPDWYQEHSSNDQDTRATEPVLQIAPTSQLWASRSGESPQGTGLTDLTAQDEVVVGDSTALDWLEHVRVGYDDGFVIASDAETDLDYKDLPFDLLINGWGQLRHTVLQSEANPLTNPDVNQFQLKRARLIFSGSVFKPEFVYFLQLDGRSSSGDDMRLLDYFLAYDFGRALWGCAPGTIGFKTGKYKMPFTMARWLTGREFEFADRSMASMYFDVNRSLAWGLYGRANCGRLPVDWETALFNGLVTGGAETGSSGSLDTNFAFSIRLSANPIGDWGTGELADFDCHRCLATRVGIAAATSTISRMGRTEFDSIRVVDSGEELSNILPQSVFEYKVGLISIDHSLKYRGFSSTFEYYFRGIGGFRGAAISDLFDHGFWLQMGYFIVPKRLQLLTRWSRVVGNSGTLGTIDQSSDEIAGGMVWYFREQHAKFTLDLTNLDGAPINSASLDISPGDIGWLYRTQVQFSF